MREGSFTDGKQTGRWVTYDKDGKVVKITQMGAKVKNSVKPGKTPAIDLKAYSKMAGNALGGICETLRLEIEKIMPKNSGRIFYAAPVWLIDENPVVGYFVSKKGHVTLLFWSGQSFKTPGLEPEGKFKAAQAKYESVAEIDRVKLRKWLRESKKIMWNYRDIRKNKGKMELL